MSHSSSVVNSKFKNSAISKSGKRIETTNGRRRISLNSPTFSLIQNIVEKNVPKSVCGNGYFSKLICDQRPSSSSTDQMDDDSSNKRIVVKEDEQKPSIDRRLIKRQAPESSDDFSAICDRNESGEIGDDVDDRSSATRPKPKAEIVDDPPVDVGRGMAKKKFRPSPDDESNSDYDTPPRDDSFAKKKSLPRRKSEVAFVRRRGTSSPSSEDDDEKRTEKLTRSEPASSRLRRKRVSDEEEEREKFTFFFTKKFVFSNHYPCRFEIDGRMFNCTEQFYMYMKAVHFGDQEAADAIMYEDEPKKMKSLGARVRGFKEYEWNKEDVGRKYMRQGNLAKYQQDKDLRKKLFDTVGTTLVEASPYDQRWGIGLDIDSPLRLSRRNWPGKNWLGDILTSIRQELMLSGDYDEELEN